MLQSPFDNENDILERLKHPEQEAEKRKISKNLFVRNILNSLFILIAVIAMIGITVSDKQSPYDVVWLGIVCRGGQNGRSNAADDWKKQIVTEAPASRHKSQRTS